MEILMREVEKESFSTKRAVILARKVVSRDGLVKTLVDYC